MEKLLRGTIFAKIVIVLFGISLIFPIGAATVEATLPAKEWGFFDVFTAGLLALASLVIAARYRSKITAPIKEKSYAIYRAVAILLLVFGSLYIFVPTIRWEAFISGFIWRAWLFVYLTPYVLAGLEDRVDTKVARRPLRPVGANR